MPSDIHLTPPEGWSDRSMLAYAAPARPAQQLTPNIVVTRDSRVEDPPGQLETFDAYIERQLAEIGSRLGGLRIEQRQSGSVNDITAYDLRFTWQSAQGPVRQRTVFLKGPDPQVLTFAATAAEHEYDAYREHFERALASLRIDTPVGGEGAPG